MSEEEIKTTGYVSLHNHTSFSILDSLISPKDLFRKAKELGQTAIAVTDHGTLAGMWDSLKASKETGVKLIAGCEFYFVDDVKNEDARMSHIILLAKNAKGYENLLKASAEGYDNFIVSYKKVFARIDWNILEKYSEGIICTTACANGILGQRINEKKHDTAIDNAKRLKNIFGDDLAIELQPHALKRYNNAYSGEIDQIATNKRLRKIAEELDIRCIVATDSHYVEKSQHDSHDVLLAVAAGSPVDSGMRLKYQGAEMHIKSEEEVYNKLARITYDKEFARKCIDNTKYFADKCEFPDWIDPKFSNPSGKELPEFPVKDQVDYSAFLEWRNVNPHLEKDEDEAYLRYLCDLGLKEKIHPEKYEEYKARLEEEFEVMEHHKFSSYMLIVMDYVQWAKNNDIPVGPGRGCLTFDTKVLTKNGFVNIDSVSVGDEVYTHKGRLRKVYNKFVYNIDEVGLSIGTNYSFDKIKLTKDHKVFASVSSETEQYIRLNKACSPSLSKVKRWNNPGVPSWISAEDLKIGDNIFMPFPKRQNVDRFTGSFDLAQFNLSEFGLDITEDKIIQKIPIDNNISIRAVSKGSGVDRGAVKRIHRGKKVNKKSIDKVEAYLHSSSRISLNECLNTDNTYKKVVDRYLKKDNDLLYVIGRWVGDGWIGSHPSNGYHVGFAFNSDDKEGIERIKSYFDLKGFVVSRHDAKDRKLVQLIIKGSVLAGFFKHIISDYERTSKTKHLPTFFRSLGTEELKHMLNGLCDSDGHVEISKEVSRENFDTTSKRLALEFKEALLYLGIPSSINTRQEFMHGEYGCSKSYKVRFKGLKLNKSSSGLITDNGYFCKVTSLEAFNINTVYDISVDEDVSYLTSNYAVHNSVGGSLIGYLVNIHAIDPIKYGLIFARFHNKEKTSFPDIDTDFAPSGRAKVQNYIRSKYGADQVAHVSNVNTMTPKVYARAIARAFVYGGDRKTAVRVGTALADAIPPDIKSVSGALEKAALFGEYAKPISEGGAGYTELARYAKDLGGISMAWSTHAGGVVIGRRSLRGLIPIRRDKDGNVSIEYEKDRAEYNGLVKMDTLGLETLDIIKNTYDLIRANGKVVSVPDLEAYDQAAYDLISRGDTFCVFQLGTSIGTMELCKSVKPKNIEDIAIINSLARPSARDIRGDYVAVRNGDKPMDIMHPSLDRAFKPTLGFGLYEECLLYLAQDVAGWDLHSADRLRKLTKAKGKEPEKAERWKQEFISGAVERGIAKKIATSIWEDVIDKFQGYGFNKPHAVFYSLIGYHTAWLKAHYPLEFLVANLKSEVGSGSKDSKENVAKIKEEIRSLGVKILPPDINRSDTTYKIIDEKTLLTGFDALKFMGNDAMPEILVKRPFDSFESFLTGVDGRKVRSTTIQALAASGCLDSFGKPKKLMYLYSTDYKKKLQAFLKNQKKNPEKYKAFDYPWPENGEWTLSEICALEKFYIGESLSGNKIQEFGGFFTQGAPAFKNLQKIHPPPPDSMSISQQRKYTKRVTLMQAEIKSVSEFKVKKEDSKIYGEVMSKLLLEDPFGNQIFMTCFPDSWVRLQNRALEISNNKQKIEAGCGIYLNANLNWYDGALSLIYEDLVKFIPPPPLPIDLKAKKVSMKRDAKSKSNNSETDDRNLLLDEIEDELIEMGNSDLDDDDE